MPVPSRCVDSSSTAPTSLVSISKVFLVHWLRCRSSIIAGNGLTARTATQLIATLLHQTSLPRPIAITLDGGTKLSSTDASIASLPREIREGSFADALTFVAELKKAKQATYRHKIMLVGHQAVGKTSLLHAMFPLCARVDNAGDVDCIQLRGSKLVIVPATGARIVLELRDGYSVVKRDQPMLALAVSHKQFPSHITPTRYRFREQSGASIDDAISDLKPATAASALTIEFPPDAVAQFNEWHKAISHWTCNGATEGIDALHVSLKGNWDGFGKEKVPRLDLCIMDFAGQPESVACHACIQLMMSQILCVPSAVHLGPVHVCGAVESGRAGRGQRSLRCTAWRAACCAGVP